MFYLREGVPFSFLDRVVYRIEVVGSAVGRDTVISLREWKAVECGSGKRERMGCGIRKRECEKGFSRDPKIGEWS
jgi:hypothetical protein